VLAATLFTLFVVPVAYDVLARRTGSPGEVKRQLEIESAEDTTPRTAAEAEN
jgi:multidrug efflux pump